MRSTRQVPRRQVFGRAATRGRDATKPKASPTCAPKTDDYISLGRSDLIISSVGVGTLAWGDPNQGYGSRFDERAITEMCTEANRLGLNFFDTAEVYGYQNVKNDSSSECLIRRNVKSPAPPERPAVVGSKYFTIPWTNFLMGGGARFGVKSLSEALDASLQRLGVEQLDLYQIHFPFPTYSQDVLMSGLRDAVESGRVKAVGVCNYNCQQLEEAAGILSKHNIPIVCNQVEYNLMNRKAESEGMLKLCEQLGITVVAHSPLKQGLLTDFALEREDKEAAEVQPLLKLLQFIGALSGGKSVEQVAMNYLLCRGAVVIPGAKNVAQLQRNAGAMGWRLDENEVEIINEKLQSMNV